MPINTYSAAGTKATTPAKLNKAIFETEVKSHDLIKAAYMAYLDNGRPNSAKVKNRGDVSGGGRKPWRQKGTGRARFGSSRNPIWRGGGAAFGPTGNENYTAKLNTGSKRKATIQALSLAAQSNKISIIDTIEAKTAKTKDLFALLNKMGLKGDILIVTDTKNESLVKSVANLQDVTALQANYLNVYGIMNADHILITTKALTMIDEWLGGVK